MPGEVEEEGVGEVVEVAFPAPEVPRWDRSATAAGVILDQVLHDPDLPPGVDRAPRGKLLLKNAPPVQIPAAIGSL